MDNFITPDGIENMGGAASFTFTASTNIDTMPLAIAGKITDPITFIDNALVYDGYATEDSLEFNQSYNPDTLLYTCTLTGRTPNTGAEQTEILRKMNGTPLVAFFIDNNGVERIMGTPKNPAVFSFSDSTGQAGGTANGYSYRFTWADKLPCPVYDTLS